MSATLEQLLRDARLDLVLSRIEKDESVIREVIDHLNSDIRSVKFNAILILGELGNKSVEGLSKLNACLEDNDWSICREAARTMGKIGELAKDSIPQLSKMLNDNEESIRKEAAIALGSIGKPTNEAISGLLNTLNDESEVVRTEAAKSLGKLGSEADDAIPHLMKSLKDTSWAVRTTAAQSISNIGRGSIKAIPSLINALEDQDWRVRYRVSNTLVDIGEPAVPYLLEKLSHKDKIVRKKAVETLGEMKISDPKIVESISNLLKDRIEIVRGKAADALRSIGKISVPFLIKAIEKSNTKKKMILISALRGIGIDAGEAIPRLIDLINIPEQEKNMLRTKRLIG
ncbi:MAG: HEAT repeat domain-containing protein [Promethearchaeota archaeon]